jgi:DNA-binding CsgD family transcriptional regulator
MPQPTLTPTAGLTATSGKAIALTGLLIVQLVCTGFFLADVIADFLGWKGLIDGIDHHRLEAVIVIALGLSTALTVVEIRRMLQRHGKVEAQLKAASGAFFELLEAHFEAWSLTPSERDVALLAIKGLSIAEIAAVRQTKDGTVKAQCNAIYSKAGVSGRSQLLSLFIEELVSDRLVPAREEARTNGGARAPAEAGAGTATTTAPPR